MKLKINLGPFLFIGAICGFVIAEFFPDTFAHGLGKLGEAFSDPFSHYRNHLAIRYTFFGAAIGLAIDLVVLQLRGKK